MTEKEQKQKAKEFSEFWKDKGYEKGQSQIFWVQLLSQVFGIEKPEEWIEFEEQVHIDKHTGFMDGYISTTKVLIEQKSIDKDLRKGIRQSDGSLLTPFQQAKKYIAELPLSRHPKYVVTCNFKSFLIYDMENPNGEPEEILLKDLEKEYYRLQFLVEEGKEHLKREMEISIQAGELVGKLYDEILKLYINPEKEETLKSLNMLCVRLVFCLYAEDAGIFGKRSMFHDYLDRFEAVDLRRALMDLFKVLDTKVENRDPYMIEELSQFPYVNGGLFANEEIEIPILNEAVKELLLSKASEDFDWSDISPTIFGAVFESTLNPETRRSGGMHYTSIKNIHKVIDPLFFKELKEELEEIKRMPVIRTKKKRLMEFQDKIASLKFLDPACGSGNFLTETYLSLRKLENEVIFELTGGQIGFGDEEISPIKVSISQFYGIEINDFAVTVAKTALWIAESQMMKETENILHITLDFLPLKSYTNITEGNALRIDWNEVVPKEELNYIMGNPPFIGKKEQTTSNKDDLKYIFGKIKGLGDLDYVTGWYKKASEYIEKTIINCAFVSTNSITQGEQVAPLWKTLLSEHIEINFAYKTFKWESEAKNKAAVHCIIIGFSKYKQKESLIIVNDTIDKVSNINPYLCNAPNIIIENRTKPICSVQEISYGNVAGSKQFVISEQEKQDILKREPKLEKFIYPFMGAEEIINNKIRYCFWLKEAQPNEIRESKELSERINIIKKERESSTSESTRKKANIPHRFFFEAQPNTDMIVIPKVSSENRKYIPISLIGPKKIINGSALIIPNADRYYFGILISNVHNAWMRTVGGRMKSDYQYSKGIIYNNFTWPSPNETQKLRIQKTAQGILEARNKYPNNSLADLYDELTMPPELRKAHQENDKAVMEAYGFDWHKMTESDCVAELMKMYENKIKES